MGLIVQVFMALCPVSLCFITYNEETDSGVRLGGTSLLKESTLSTLFKGVYFYM